MKSIVDRLIHTARSATRRKSPVAKLTWCEVDASNSLACEVCETAMHFQGTDQQTWCSICNQGCGTIELTCDSCGLHVCCNERDGIVTGEEVQSSCYNSYFDPVKSVREQVYNQQLLRVSEFSNENQQRWLQCMWHDITQNLNRFRAELQHASQIDAINATNVRLIIDNLGLEISRGLVRLFIIFQTKLDSEIVTWFSSLIQHEKELMGGVAFETCVSLKGRLKQVKWLVHELNIGASNFELGGILGQAAKVGRLQIVECLIQDAKVDPSADGNYAIEVASEKGHYSVVEILLQDNRTDPSWRCNFAIRAACREGHLNVAKLLLKDDRVDPTDYDNHAVRCASANGHVEVVELLIQDVRVDPSADDDYAIRMASTNGHANVVEQLLRVNRVDPSSRGNEAIQQAASHGHLDVVEQLLQDDRVDPSANENFAIRHASRNGYLEMVEKLLQDNRVDPAAKQFEALRAAHNTKVLLCLYNRMRSVLCYMFDERDLMKKLTPLHNNSIMIGGWCLSHARCRDTTTTTTIPQDVIFAILCEWVPIASLDCD